jgi:hypothetical protein
MPALLRRGRDDISPPWEPGTTDAEANQERGSTATRTGDERCRTPGTNLTSSQAPPPYFFALECCGALDAGWRVDESLRDIA